MRPRTHALSHPAHGQPECTPRALVTGILIGALLTPCNVYSGLKIGWSFNMSIAACLLSFGYWRLSGNLLGSRAWGLYENNINQTTASAAASIVSGGLVAPIPALTLLTGREFDWPVLSLWVFTVSALGIAVAAALREPMILRDRLTFPAGVATAETVREIYARGRDAAARVRMLAGAAAASAAAKLAFEIAGAAPRLALPGQAPLFGAPSAAAPPLGKLGFALDPSLLMLGFGAIIGPRVGLSLLLGALIAWLAVAPWVLAQGWVAPDPAAVDWFGPLVQWLLWPGVTLMTTASLATFGLAWWRRLRHHPGRNQQRIPVPGPGFAGAALTALAAAVALQYILFAIPPLAGIFAVGLAFALAVVAARVVGETGIPPIGAIGKVAQLGFGAAAPGNLTANLMGANVTGGAAGQCADLLNDLKCGHLLGATPRLQLFAQLCGVLTGSLVGSLTYLTLIPDPHTQLLSPEWPAPAVATWKAVAEVLAHGLAAIPQGAASAMAVAAVTGALLAAAQHWSAARRWLPSGAALGLAFVIPAWISLGLFLGAAAAALAGRLAPAWSGRFVLAMAAGLVAGESLAGVAAALVRMAAG